MKQLSLIVLILSLAITMPVTAVDKEGAYMDVGTLSCEQWVDGRKKSGWLLRTNISYISGYLTAFNQHTPDVFNILGSSDLVSVYIWMDKHCQENPQAGLSVVMQILTQELWPNRKRTE